MLQVRTHREVGGLSLRGSDVSGLQFCFSLLSAGDCYYFLLRTVFNTLSQAGTSAHGLTPNPGRWWEYALDEGTRACPSF